ncbi:uncharacterized protein DUF1311 [Marinobacter nauticus]|uniref:Uncharacterized protein DUF1311 n=1 Tax=Marinobacter nauticus TaxID=2743 RepID=A0A368ULP2_MARNT|nr:uncharacterized protein DUF1311 [Marinobacter nauticus]
MLGSRVKSCWGIEDRFGQSSCLAEINDGLEAELAGLQKQRIGLVYNQGLEAQIAAANDAWETFRQRECSVVRDQFELASIQTAKVLECEIYLTAKRVENLQHLVGCSENGCPWFF